MTARIDFGAAAAANGNGAARSSRAAWEDGPPEGRFDAEPANESEVQRDVAFDALVTPAPRAWFTDAPPARRWLLRDTRGAGHGFMPMGKALMLAAEGGAGKTNALIQLALAVATDRAWLDTFTVETSGRVLVLLGEEDAEECHRRFYNATRELKAPPPPEGSIVVLPLAGQECALLAKGEYGNAIVTRFAVWLTDWIARNGPWSLVIVDPLSRFAGPEAEKDNAEGTRFVQMVEAIVSASGAAVLVSHHTNQGARGGGKVAASGARGVTSLTDGFRWVVTMSVQDASGGLEVEGTRERLGELVTLAHVKSNYSRKAETVLLRRLDGGLLAPLSDGDRQLVEDAIGGKAERTARVEAREAERAIVRARREEAERAKRAERDEAEAVRRRERQAAEDEALRACVAARPGLNEDALISALRARIGSCSNAAGATAIARALAAGWLEVRKEARNAKCHYAKGSL